MGARLSPHPEAILRNFDDSATSELIIVENFFEELRATVGN